MKPPPAVVVNKRPLIVVTDPPVLNNETTLPRLPVTGVVSDDRQIASLRATVNGKVIDLRTPALPSEGVKAVGVRAAPDRPRSAKVGEAQQRLASQKFSFEAELNEGSNEILIEAADDENVTSSETLTIVRDKGEGRIHIIAIGINDYLNSGSVPPLQYAVSDAREVAAALGKLTRTGQKRVREVLNEDASRQNLTDQLFYQLPTEVRPADTVIIFFSGHGAPDTNTDSQGNVETFLLPIDADPTKLFSTALRMSDVGTILKRLRSERIIFLADTCYSGAAGGVGARTVGLPGVALRAVGVRAIPKRPEGKGCAIMTASTGTQVAQEKAEFKHGIFSYYLLQGLQGEADRDRNGDVTVDELYEYVKTEVGAATNGSQTPQISRDPTAGDIVLSRVGG